MAVTIDKIYCTGERIQLVFNHLDIRIPQFAWNNGTCYSDYIAVCCGMVVL